MKLIRGLFEHFQFAVVTIGTAGFVMGLGLVGQYWLKSDTPALNSDQLSPADREMSLPSLESPPAQTPNPNDQFLDSLPHLSPGVSPPAAPSAPAAPSPIVSPAAPSPVVSPAAPSAPSPVASPVTPSLKPPAIGGN